MTFVVITYILTDFPQKTERSKLNNFEEMVAKKYQKWTQTDGEISFIASSLRMYGIHF